MIPVGEEPLRFYGPPRRLAALLHEPVDDDTFEVPVVDTGAHVFAPGTLRARIKRMAGLGMTQMLIALPRTTPPGTYRVVVPVCGRDRSAILDVQPSCESKVFPTGVYIRTHVAGRETLELTVSNIGNHPFEISKIATFVLARPDALCRAIVATVATEERDGHAIIDRMAQELKAQLGGVAVMRIKTQQRIFEPGETRHIEATLRMPEDIRPGQYWGDWPVYPSKSHRLRIMVDAPGPVRELPATTSPGIEG